VNFGVSLVGLIMSSHVENVGRKAVTLMTKLKPLREWV